MPSVLLKNLGGVVTGRLDQPLLEADCLFIEGGMVRSIGQEEPAETVIDAGGNLAVPGLIDCHCHPMIGEYSPVMDATDWVTHYVHGGVTTLIDAGAVIMPGFPVTPPDPDFVRHLALLTRKSFDRLRPSGARVISGTPVLVPGLTEADFDAFAAAGIRLVKFVYYDYEAAPPGEAQQYVRWSRARGMKVKVHTGGTSYVGASVLAGADIVMSLQPDIIAHINGGPIPAPAVDVERLVRETSCYYEIVPGGNPRITEQVLRLTVELGCLDRLLLGTDTPGGTGILPRGMLRLVSEVASATGFPAAQALAAATGNSGRAHGLPYGVLATGAPADITLVGAIYGSLGTDALDALQKGDIPGVAMVLTDGEVRLTRSRQTPPPLRAARVVRAPGIG